MSRLGLNSDKMPNISVLSQSQAYVSGSPLGLDVKGLIIIIIVLIEIITVP